MKDIKLIAIDLDSTLLHSDKSISDYSVSVLTRCAEKGVHLAYATARSARASERFVERFAPEIMVTNSGALAKIGDKIIYRAAMDARTADALISTFVREPAVMYITAEADCGYYVNYEIDPKKQGSVDYKHATAFDFARERFARATYKLTVECSSIDAVKRIKAEFDNVELTYFSGESWYRFARADATKWHGIEAVARQLGICAAEIAAFGDDYSDICMMENCGHGVAMANAIDEVKRAAAHICASNDEDGVARWIEENVL